MNKVKPRVWVNGYKETYSVEAIDGLDIFEALELAAERAIRDGKEGLILGPTSNQPVPICVIDGGANRNVWAWEFELKKVGGETHERDWHLDGLD